MSDILAGTVPSHIPFSHPVDCGPLGSYADKVTRTTSSDPERSVLLRGLSILECFESRRVAIGVPQLSRATGLPASTVHRQLATLMEWGAVERVARGEYQLGMRMWILGSSVPRARRLRDVALPHLEDLYEATHEVVHLTVRDGLETLYVEKISGNRSTVVTTRVGRRLPLHATGPGKVLLAYSPTELFDEVVDHGLPAMTAQTITDPDELRRHLAEIRMTGVAVSRGESSLDHASVAAPVFAASGEVVASISAVMPTESFDAPVLTPLVVACSRAISRSLGFAKALAGNPRRRDLSHEIPRSAGR